MHATLASIGRAYTVEDEEPPETLRNNSIERHSKHDIKISMPGGLQQLVDYTVSLSASIRLIPCLNGEIALYRNENAKQCLKNEKLPDIEWKSEGQPLPTSPPDRLVMLHNLCESTQRALHLEFLADICKELGCGLRSLATYSAGVTRAEYEATRRLSTPHFPHRPFPLSARPGGPYDGLEGKQPSDLASHATRAIHGDFSSTQFDVKRRSQLSDLRVICESLRQCLTQVQQLEHEQTSLRLTADGIASAGSSLAACNVLATSSESLFRRHTGHLVTDVVVAAHHLVYSGLRSLTKTDLTSFTHDELWEITRGIEELDILTKHLQTVFNVLHVGSLRQFLCRRKFEYTVEGFGGEGSTSTCCISSMLNTLVCDPLMTVPCISIGYMFDLIARERSVRLANSVYSQLSAMIFIVPSAGSKPLQSYLTGSVMTPTSLVEAFRAYLHENYDRSASEYLRSEYEFISCFLDILSQSTNLLHEVQRLSSVYNAVEALLTRQSARSDNIPSPDNFSFVSEKGTKLQHALSVEGKHGILVKGTPHKLSRIQPPSGACPSTQDKDGKKSGLPTDPKNKKFTSHLQELLQRSDTLDRYVATGTCLSPFASQTVLPAVNNPPACSARHEDNATNRASPSPLRDHPSTKKAVQWSDQRDIRIRHQVIGRYLEMTWCHTEHSLHTQLLWPPSELVVRGQMADGRQTRADTCGSVTSCLLLPAHQLHTISRRIREVAKSDLLPAGLLPVLQSESLRLAEMANNRRWFEAWLRTTGTSIVAPGSPSSDQRPPTPAPQDPSTVTFDCPTPCPLDAPNATGHCALAFIQRFHDTPADLEDHLLSRPAWRAYREVSLAGTSVDVMTVHRIVHSLTRHVVVAVLPAPCASGCTDRQESSLLCVGQVFEAIEQNLRVLGLFSASTSPTNTMASTPVNLEGRKSHKFVYDLLYSLSRRLNLASNRLSSLLTAHLYQLRKVSADLLDTSRRYFPTLNDLDSSQQHTCSAKLTSAIRLVCLVQAKVCQLSDILHQLQRLCNLPMAVVVAARTHSDRPLVGSDCWQTAAPDWSALFHGLASQLEPTGASACKVASFVSTLCRWSTRLESMQQQLLTADCQFQQMSCKLWATFLSPAYLSLLTNRTGDQRPEGSSSSLQVFTSAIVSATPPCTALFQSVPTVSQPTDCTFHSRVYRKVLATLVDSLCSVWLEQLVADSLQENRTVMIRRHTNSLHLFTRLLLTSTTHATDQGPSAELPSQTTAQQTALATVLCESQAFQQLQTSTLGPYDHLVTGLPNDSVHKCAHSAPLPEPSSSPSEVPPSGQKGSTSRQTAKEKLSLRSSPQGAALLALATGVRTTFTVPLRLKSARPPGDRPQSAESSSYSSVERQRLARLPDAFKLSTESNDSR